MKNYLLLSMIVLVICGCQNQSSKSDTGHALATYLSECANRGLLNGTVLIAQKGNVIFENAFGINGNGNDLDLASQFRLASVSKQFTAMAIMTLMEARALDYEDLITKHLPEWPYKGNATIRNLLTHTAGMPDYEGLTTKYWKPELEPDDPVRTVSGNDEVFTLFAEHMPDIDFEPGEKYEYSNTGYLLLASIVTRVSGRPFYEYLREVIFEPSEMSDTYVFSPLRTDPLNHRVYGFKKSLDGKKVLPHDYHFLNPVEGDGGIFSTLHDLLNWDRTLYTDQLVSKSTLEEAFTPFILNNGDTTDYGYGWGIRESLAGKKMVAHSGGWVGFGTWIGREIEDDNTIIFLTNNSNFNPTVLRGIQNILHDQPHELPKGSIAEHLAPIILSEGSAVAVTEYLSLKETSFDDYNFTERQLNGLGYRLIEEGKPELAVAIFTLNTDVYPESANLWDSLGDGYLTMADTINGIVAFEKALALDPEMEGTRDKLEGLVTSGN